MHLSALVSEQPDSPIAVAYESAGGWCGAAEVLDLGQAAPPYAPAPVVTEHVAAVARAPGGSAYLGGAGLPRLREAFAADVRADYGGHVEPEHVVITAGCNQAFCVVMSALAQAGDEVVLPLPAYFNHEMWLRMQGIAPVLLEPGEDMIPAASAAEALIGPRTRAIVVVTPGNPSGATVPPDGIQQFADLAARRGIALVLDETYRSFRERDESAHHLFRDPGWGDNVVSLHSFSKDLAIPGYRVGAVLASSAVNREILKVLDCVAIGAPRVGQEAAWAGLTRAASWRRDRVQEVARRRAAFASAMCTRPGGFEVVSCGAFFAWLRHPFAAPTREVVRTLVTEHGLLTIPGTAFLPDDRAMLRMSVAGLDERHLADLMSRLRAAGTGVDDGPEELVTSSGQLRRAP